MQPSYSGGGDVEVGDRAVRVLVRDTKSDTDWSSRSANRVAPVCRVGEDRLRKRLTFRKSGRYLKEHSRV